MQCQHQHTAGSGCLDRVAVDACRTAAGEPPRDRHGLRYAIRQLGDAALRLHRARDLRGQLLGRALNRFGGEGGDD